MIYRCTSCAVCGSDAIKEIATSEVDEDTFITYKCNGCDATFTSKKPTLAKTVASQPSGGEQELSAMQIFEQMSKSVLEIESRYEDQTSSGTGYVISRSGYVITNAHVVAEVNRQNDIVENLSDVIYGKNKVSNTTCELELIACDIHNDIALLKIDRSITDFIPLKNTKVKTGEKIFAIGNSKGEGLCLLDGIVSDESRRIGDNYRIMISALVTTGNSGCPIFNRFGEIVGMVVSGRKDTVSMNYVIPISDVLDFVSGVERKERIRILED